MQSFFYCLIVIFCGISVQSTRGFSIVSKRSIGSKQETDLKKYKPCAKKLPCVPPIQCPAHVRMTVDEKPPHCDLPDGSYGLCCASGQNHTVTKHEHHGHLYTRSKSEDSHDHRNMKQFRSIIEEGRSAFASELQKEKHIPHTIQKGNPEFFHNLLFRTSHVAEARTLALSQDAMEIIYASRAYKAREHVSSEDFELGQVSERLDGTAMSRNCHFDGHCSEIPIVYRSIDGTCNNPQHKEWGAARTSTERLLPPSYEDGIWEPRKFSVDGTFLPNPRTISREILRDVDRPHPKLNLLFMQFGQLITHDVTQSASTRTTLGKSISCCAKGGTAVLPDKELHYACFPIEIEGFDEFYSKFNQKCMNFVRSSLAPSLECKLGYGKQISKVTHYMDCSPMYGNDLNVLNQLRKFKGGELLMMDDFGRELLPTTMDKGLCGSEQGGCFLTGDFRANQLISMTTLHILFAREHNHIARALSEVNPHWTDETLFFEARSILIAKFQHIAYNEWLPHAIGTEKMNRFGLGVKYSGYSTDYNPYTNAAVTAEFTTAAFRFGHSMVDGKFIVHHGQHMDEVIKIPDVMFNTAKLRQRNFYDEMLNTLTNQPMQQVDSAITQGLAGFLFRGHNPFGLDLAAINIHRGRDHGIRCYNDYLEVTGHKRITDFSELGGEIAEQLSKLYKHPDDIDLWVGGLMETSNNDALLGHTLSEIVADQFSRLKRGDRYFYDLDPQINPGFFSPDQLQEIRTTTLARIICDNVDGFAKRTQAPNAFIQANSPGNPELSCDDYSGIPQMSYEPWKER